MTYTKYYKSREHIGQLAFGQKFCCFISHTRRMYKIICMCISNFIIACTYTDEYINFCFITWRGSISCDDDDEDGDGDDGDAYNYVRS